jgi:hypothetical protein
MCAPCVTSYRVSVAHGICRIFPQESAPGGAPLDEGDETEKLKHAVQEVAPEAPSRETSDGIEATGGVSEDPKSWSSR